MFRVFNCLTEEYDWRLVVLAGLACLLTSLVVVSLYRRSHARPASVRARHAWIPLVAGVATGCGIWATYFIAIAACGPTVTASARWTAVSLVITAIVAVAGLFAAVAKLARWARAQRLSTDSREQLRQQNVRLDTALNNMTQGLCMFNADEEIVVFNRRFLEMYKLSPQVVKPGCKLRDLIQHRLEVGLLDADADEHYSRIMADIRQGKTTTWVVKTTDGRLVQTFDQPMPGGGWVTTHEDITERRHAEDQVREQKLQMDAALENMTQGLVMFDGDGRIILWNRHYLDLYNLPPEVMKPGLTLQDLLRLRKATGTFMRDPEIYVAELRAALLAGKRVTITPQLGDGRTMCIENRPMAGGGWVSTHEDITERRQAEQQLREQKQQLDTGAEQHVARSQHVRCVRPPRCVQRALSADVRSLTRDRAAGLHRRRSGPGSHRQRHILRGGQS